MNDKSAHWKLQFEQKHHNKVDHLAFSAGFGIYLLKFVNRQERTKNILHTTELPGLTTLIHGAYKRNTTNSNQLYINYIEATKS